MKGNPLPRYETPPLGTGSKGNELLVEGEALADEETLVAEELELLPDEMSDSPTGVAATGSAATEGDPDGATGAETGLAQTPPDVWPPFGSVNGP